MMLFYMKNLQNVYDVGIPDWLAKQLDENPDVYHNCSNSLPGVAKLVGPCMSFASYSIDIDPITKHPKTAQCLKNEFDRYYATAGSFVF